LLKYQAPNKLNRLLEREYQLDENIIRYLIIYLDPKAEKRAQSRKPSVTEEVKSDVSFIENPVIPSEISTIVTETAVPDVALLTEIKE
jgi:hypothetical protein